MPTAAALPALTARLTPTPVCVAQFSNDDTKLPDWLAIAIRPGGGFGRDDLRAQARRRRHDALAVGPREQDAELVGERDELALGAAAVVARLAVAGAREERGADAAPRARAQQIGVRARPACTRTRGPTGRRGGRRRCATVSTPSTGVPSRFVAPTLPA